MFRPTLSLQKSIRRLPLSTKQAGKEYYKGNGIGNLGVIDKFGRFHPDWSKIRTYVYPSNRLQDFQLTPFVDKSTSPYIQKAGGQWEVPKKTFTNHDYLRLWMDQGGDDRRMITTWDDNKMASSTTEELQAKSKE